MKLYFLIQFRKHRCQLYLLEFFLFFNKFFFTKEKCFSEMQSCFAKAYIIFPVLFMHFLATPFILPVVHQTSSDMLLSLWAILFSTSAISLPFRLFVVDSFSSMIRQLYSFFRHLMHFQILPVQSAHKLRSFHGRCESLENNSSLMSPLPKIWRSHMLCDAFTKVVSFPKQQCSFHKISWENNRLWQMGEGNKVQ